LAKPSALMNHDPSPTMQGSSEAISTQNLFDLVESKLHLLTEMHEMSITQSDLVAQHDMTALMALLSRKQGLMDSLHEVQTRLTPFQSQDPDTRNWSHPDRRKACQSMIAKCDALLQQMIVMENRSLDNMVVQRELVSAQIQQNIDASTIQNAYQSCDRIETLAQESFSLEG